ncbi:MAG TPA: 23S rRNA (pseudouridine(1915)-N(3))-methyltransferase RlmH [Saprospiraceae bacterium]|jgi:23S rRNA (pseudouridine1915-N3)-methyltransferase|nr:23S rRNA (pseudouridine(1915)-N(3))-methyltransferase RlmH [Saprospiraceae bacterium]
MKIELIVIGKTNFSFIEEGIMEYKSRINHFINFEIIVLPDVKQKLPIAKLKEKESEVLLNYIQSKDMELYLLDDKGKEYTSIDFSLIIQDKVNIVRKDLAFIVGGAYGFSQVVYKTIPNKISFSRFTFSHQLIRLIFVEQLYRAFTIIKNLPYHHE